MKTNYLIKFLIENSSKEYAYCLDLLKHELDWHIYDYGDHINHVYRRGKRVKKEDLKLLIKYIFNVKHLTSKNENKIMSFIPFSFDEKIREMGFEPYSTIFNSRKSCSLVRSLFLIKSKFQFDKIIRLNDYNKIIKNDLDFILNFKSEYLKIIKKAKMNSLFVMTDQQFFSRISIDVFNNLNKNTFIFSHGLPGIYSKDLDNRSKYLMLWGESIKKNYMDAGFDRDKLIVIGNVKYNNLKQNKKNKITWCDTSVVVFPEASINWHQHTYGDPTVIDRSRMILYLYEVQKVLLKVGIKHARYRLHPSINQKWVNKFIDNKFYTVEKCSLEDTLNNSSLIIGNTSTTFLEAIQKGVNYIVYERNNIKLLNPPFDGTDPRVPFASEPDKLQEVIKNKKVVDNSLLDDYMQPFNKKLLKELVNA